MKKTNKTTFIMALNQHHKDELKTKKFFKDKRLSTKEKEILKAWILVRDHKFSKIYEILSFTQSQCDLVESQRELILGISKNNESDFPKAIEHLEKSLKLMDGYAIPRMIFMGLDVLFLAYRNTFNKRMASATLDRLESAKRDRLIDEIALVRNKVFFYLMENKVSEAAPLLNWLEDHKSEMTASQAITHQVIRMEYFTQNNQVEKYEDVLNELKSYRKFNSGAFYKYLKAMGDNFCKDKPMYAYRKDFEKFPLLLNHIMVIKRIEEGDFEAAKYHWSELRELDLKSYGDAFNYTGEKCLFSLCLEKHLSKNIIKPVEKKYSRKEDQVIDLLRVNNGVVSKEDMFKMIWPNEEYDKVSVLKLNKLISRVRKNIDADIKSKKGFLYLEDNSQESA